MRPPVWNPPISLPASEQKVAQRIRKAKLFLFLRQIRHELFDLEFQQELAKVFKDSTVGLCPVPPAQIALAIILQAYTGVSDDGVMPKYGYCWRNIASVLECFPNNGS